MISAMNAANFLLSLEGRDDFTSMSRILVEVLE